ncbi:TOMM precursor leader peptide-binding protein [Nocardioides marmotae]|uniref:TOMM precursor leader peptide-binding protein n=1 Tax=Nocardioides marmotae TaxID=2663857 RepID=UPI0012B6403C|nr:TOMM precursor leader peptide-binding protein [Nocardioides marmotae]MBC9733321.1 TOMM precursor leader peptide-binding protein [Nocardioides marmotae]MTB84429.1 TOMM precursor leader peptide-binding protein [Nocardioides marmotae]
MSRTLLPGLVAVRRDDGHLQVGLDLPRRAVLPDTPEVRRVLAALEQGRSPEPDATATRVLAALESAGLLVDADPRPGGPIALAARARHGDDAARRLAARAAAVVSLDAPPDWAEPAAALLAAAGVATTRSGLGAVHLVLSPGVLARGRVDPCLRAGVPHLLVAGRDGGPVVGPFVAPGVTGCLRCDDARRAEADPRRAIVLEQLARATPPAADPVCRALALAWAVRDVVAWVEGDRPSTWGAAYELGAATPVRVPVDPHPHCGCTWGALGGRRTG